MRYSERMMIVMRYRNWLMEEWAKNRVEIKDCPETFLVFLETIGYLKEGDSE